MGLDPHNIPQQMRRYMPATDPESAAAQARCHAATDAKLEREMHGRFATWLTHHAAPVPVPFVHSRMDKPSTIREGWPDFTVCWYGRVACVEFKLPGQEPSIKQLACIDELTRAHVPVRVCYNLVVAMDFIRTMFRNKGNET